MADFNIDLESVSIGGSNDSNSEEELIDVLSTLKDIDEEGVFKNQIINLDAEDREDISIVFRGERGSHNFLEMHLGGDEGELHLHANIDPDDFEKYLIAIQTLIERIGEVHIHEYHARFRLERKFSEIDLPIVEDTNYDVVGIRVRRDEGDYIIQEDGEESLSGFTLDIEDEFVLTESFEDDVIISKAQTAKEFLGGL